MGISILLARGISSELVARGLDAAHLLSKCGITPARMCDLRETLDIREIERLVDGAIALSGDPAVCLLAGARAPEHTLQLFGSLILAQHTIRDAHRALTRYGTLLAEGTTWSLREYDDLAEFSITSVLADSDLSRALLEYSIAFTVNIGRHFFQPNERLFAIHFRHATPPHAHAYDSVFHCPVRFEQEKNCTVFARALLDRPHLHADSAVDHMLRESADRLLSERTSRTLTERVRSLLRYERQLGRIDIREAARRLKLGVHTMRKRLGSEGTSFSSLYDEARCRLARQELLRGDATIQQTAELLGFSETSAFFRAFKRWTGQTPSEFRRMNSGDQQASQLQ